MITQGNETSKTFTDTIIIKISARYDGKTHKTMVREHLLNLRHIHITEGHIKIADNVKPKNITIIIKQDAHPNILKISDWDIGDTY